MFAVKRTGWVLGGIAAVLAGCASTGGGNLSSSAERLERSAELLEAEARDENLSSDLREDVRAFVSETRDFRRALSDSDRDGDDVRAAYSQLSERYHALREEVEQEDDLAADEDFQDVTEAYLDVEREMRRYRVAEGR